MISLVLSVAFVLAILDYCIGWESIWYPGIGVGGTQPGNLMAFALGLGCIGLVFR
jgi:hypothetical protein